MKKTFLALMAILVFAGLTYAQADPVKWSFSAKKVSDKVYDVYMTAQLNTGWHIYSQTQTKDAIALPTEFSFTSNPLLTTTGKVKEQGKMEKFYDKELKVSANQYSKTVSFVQRVTLKTKVKTNLAGVVEYQTCNDKMCLPPKKVNFKVPLG
ncbi:MAG: protein-disulfide reductase DsbD domain-containing protein [Niabella sp.]